MHLRFFCQKTIPLSFSLSLSPYKWVLIHFHVYLFVCMCVGLRACGLFHPRCLGPFINQFVNSISSFVCFFSTRPFALLLLRLSTGNVSQLMSWDESICGRIDSDRCFIHIYYIYNRKQKAWPSQNILYYSISCLWLLSASFCCSLPRFLWTFLAGWLACCWCERRTVRRHRVHRLPRPTMRIMRVCSTKMLHPYR